MNYRLNIIGTFKECQEIWNDHVPVFVRSDPLSCQFEVEGKRVVSLCAPHPSAIGFSMLQPTPKGYNAPVVMASEVLCGD